MHLFTHSCPHVSSYKLLQIPHIPVQYAFNFTAIPHTGMIMCAVIVCCNLSVIRVLYRMRERLLPRRHSRASCRSAASTNGEANGNLATPEELSFARLMAILSITFVVCWVPQLVSGILSLLLSIINFNNETNLSRFFPKTMRIYFTILNFLYNKPST